MVTKRFDGVISGAIAFAATSTILLFSFLCGGIFPFGTGTISWCDMNQQAIPLLCDFKDILSGKASMFLNLSNAGGMNFYGVFFFFLSSPFSFLVAFIEKADIPFLMNILILLKLAISGFCAAFTFKKLFATLSNCLSAILGISYALCGYGMAFYQNIMWLDMMYLLPLTVLGAYRLITLRRPALFFVCLSLGIVFNFYISFMVFLFVVLFFGVYAVIYKNSDRGIYLDLAFCGIGALLVTAVVWIPCFLQYTSSARNSNTIYNLGYAHFLSEIPTTLPILLCTALIFAAIPFAFARVIEKKTERFLSVLLLLLTVPIFIKPVNMMWHTGSYMAFPARYGHITVFLGLMLAAQVLTSVSFPQKSKLRGIIICTLVTTAAIIGGTVFCLKNVEKLSHYVQTLSGNSISLSGLVILCGIAFIGYFVLMCFIHYGDISRRAATILLCLIVASEGFSACNIYMLTAKNKLGLYDYQSFISLNNEIDDKNFYRVNTTGKMTHANMTGAAGFNSISHYTSLNDRTFMEAAKQLGYSGYWMETGNWDGSILSDALLSIGYTVVWKNGEFYLQKNPYFCGLGIKSADEVPIELSNHDRLSAVGDAFSVITGSENPVTYYSPSKIQNCTISNKDSIYSIAELGKKGNGTIKYTLNITDRQTLYFDCYNGFSNSLVEPINDSFAVSVNGADITASYPSQSQNGLLNLGSFENETVNITLYLVHDLECSSFGVFGVDENIVKSAVNQTYSLNLKADSNDISGKVLEKGEYFISLPFNENYNITLNGEKISFKKALSGFISIDIPHEGELKITLLPKGFIPSAIISVIGLILTALTFIFKKKIYTLIKPLQNIVLGIFLGVTAVVLLSVYIIPIILNLIF